MSDFQPLCRDTMQRRLAFRKRYFRPQFKGIDALGLPKPALFVGNHTLYGLLDVPLMIEHIYVNHGVHLRSLGDRGHFNIPIWRDRLVEGGMVLGSPENCDALMASGESILVFPGGAREVWRRKGEEYQLIWKKRLGFVRMAIRHGYDIVPFGAVGADECYTIMADANDMMSKPWFSKFLERTGLHEKLRGGDTLPTVGRGIGPTLLPKPQCFYFGFGERIPTAHLKSQEQDEAVLWAVRDQVARAITEQIEEMKNVRQQDRAENWGWLRRRLTREANT